VFIRRPSDIGAMVRAARQARGLNQQELSDKLGVSRWWVNEFERGKATARLDIVLRTLNELGITLSASLAGDSEIEPSTAGMSGTGIDIDDIADTGLEPLLTLTAPSKGRLRKKRR
jgi:HTH-type transcriptional regulator/antitoxin HipB